MGWACQVAFIQSLTFGFKFNQRLEEVSLPSGLQTWWLPTRSPSKTELAKRTSELDKRTLELHTCTCWKERCQMICRNWLSTVMSFRHLNTWACQMVQRLAFCSDFIGRLDEVCLPSGLQSLTFECENVIQGVGRSEMANGSSELDVWLQAQPEHARSSFAKWSSNLEIQPLFWQDLWGSELAKQSSEFDIRWWFRQYAGHVV